MSVPLSRSKLSLEVSQSFLIVFKKQYAFTLHQLYKNQRDSRFSIFSRRIELIFGQHEVLVCVCDLYRVPSCVQLTCDYTSPQGTNISFWRLVKLYGSTVVDGYQDGGSRSARNRIA